LWGHFTVEQERKLQSENARLSRAVVSTQEQAAVLIMKFFTVVPVKIDEAAAKRLPPFPAWTGKRSFWSSHIEKSLLGRDRQKVVRTSIRCIAGTCR
jgi:hypothetical protein